MTTNTSNNLRHFITIINGNEKTVIKIRLNDECRNGHEDFAITAEVYTGGETRGWRESMGGCCHEHILKLRPDLAPFVALHLSTWEGVPMHAIANAFYWYAGTRADGCGQEYHGGSGRDGKSPEECREIFKDHIRADDAHLKAIEKEEPRTQQELQYVLESLGFPQRWNNQAAQAIALLEEMIGDGVSFKSEETRKIFTPLSPESVALIAERRASVYYEPEQVAARDAAKLEAIKAEQIAEIEKDFERAAKKANNKRLVDLYMVRHGRGDKNRHSTNVIFYEHTHTLTFNWSTTSKLWTREEFDKFMTELRPEELPAGLKFEFQEKPKQY